MGGLGQVRAARGRCPPRSGLRRGTRSDRVKSEERDVWEPSTRPVARSGGGFLISSENPFFIQELTMADLAFVVTTIAVFALVALVAKGVAKL
ncbi:hypothetical protein EES43_01270 [Streptomyces sp. ADI96-02]|nr:hypothetical protein EES43_01270 [Streptomyces sp. ADI96-02]